MIKSTTHVPYYSVDLAMYEHGDDSTLLQGGRTYMLHIRT